VLAVSIMKSALDWKFGRSSSVKSSKSGEELLLNWTREIFAGDASSMRDLSDFF
jgi:hypothetical protein